MISRYEALDMLVECPRRLHHAPKGRESYGLFIHTNKCVGIPCTDNYVAFTVAMRSQCGQLRLRIGRITASEKRMEVENHITSSCDKEGEVDI